MKERLRMEKRLYKKGITLIEVIIALLLFGIIFFSNFFITTKLFEMTKNNEQLLEQSLFLEQCYDLFTVDPINFKSNLSEAYGGAWENETYSPKNYINLEIKHYETEEFIHIFILSDGEVKEEWVRKKVTL